MALGKIVDGAKIQNGVQLDPMKELSHYFPAPLVLGMLHLVIHVPRLAIHSVLLTRLIFAYLGVVPRSR